MEVIRRAFGELVGDTMSETFNEIRKSLEKRKATIQLAQLTPAQLVWVASTAHLTVEEQGLIQKLREELRAKQEYAQTITEDTDEGYTFKGWVK